MTSVIDEPSALLGVQRPRLSWVPPYVSSAGAEAVELAAMAGLDLDPWQGYGLAESLGEQPDGRWAAFEVGWVVARQNGKGGVLEARELAGLFLLGERLIIHSAHLFDTSLEAFRRLLALIEDTPELDRRVQRVSRAHGEEGIELQGGQRIRFRTRTSGGGRGFTADCLILDEAMILRREMMGALLPTLSARPNPQVWYTGSAVDEEVHEHGQAFAKVRERGVAHDPRLAFFEWSVDPDEYAANPGRVATDPRSWAQANPGLGIRISHEYVANEQRSLAARTFATERLSIGHWPRTDDDADRVIPDVLWRACGDPESAIPPASPVVFAIDVTPNRDKASIAVAGLRQDGLPHFEVVENEAGTSWVVARCVSLRAAHRNAKFVLVARSPAAALLEDFRAQWVTVDEMDAAEYGQAVGMFFDLVKQGAARYPAPQPELDLALGAVERRPSGDTWVWSRKSPADISPLVAATVALFRARTAKPVATRFVSLADALAAAQ